MGVLTERRQLWVDRLRDGSFKQNTVGVLTRQVEGEPQTYCCLGVATVLCMQETPEMVADQRLHHVVYKDLSSASSTVLINSVVDWLGARTPDGDFGNNVVWTTEDDGFTCRWHTLVDMNDAGVPFDDIADAIVGLQDQLFTPDPDGSRIS